jgi:hypothetical protein
VTVLSGQNRAMVLVVFMESSGGSLLLFVFALGCSLRSVKGSDQGFGSKEEIIIDDAEDLCRVLLDMA